MKSKPSFSNNQTDENLSKMQPPNNFENEQEEFTFSFNPGFFTWLKSGYDPKADESRKRKRTEADEEADKLKERIRKRKLKKTDPDEEEETQKEVCSFADLGISKPLIRALSDMDISVPTQIQKETIPVALLGKDIYGCAATGTGKTIAFMLPVLERLLFKPLSSPVTRVLALAPTRELALQLFEVTQKLKKHAGQIYCTVLAGGLDEKEQASQLRRCPDIVVATPGRLLDHLNSTPSFGLDNLEVLILDEADRMLDEHFIEQVKEILKYCCPHRQTMLFSATLTEGVDDLAGLSLKNPVRVYVNNEDEVSINISQEFVKIKAHMESKRDAILAALLVRNFPKRTVVFFHSKKALRRVSELLRLLGLKIGELHGNLRQPKRIEALRQFKNGTFDILLATDVASRGIDILGLETVINYTLPNEVTGYVHRVGRTARAGKVGRAVSLVGEAERKVLKQITKRSKNPLKERQVNKAAIAHFQEKISAVQADLEQRLKDTKADEELEQASALLGKADELLQAKPAQIIKSAKDRIKKNVAVLAKSKYQKTRKQKKREMCKLTSEEAKAVSFGIRSAKRQFRAEENGQSYKAPKKKKKFKKRKDFTTELTDVSRTSVKKFRYEGREKQFGKDKRKGKKK